MSTRAGGSIRAYQAIEHELAELMASVDSEDVRVWMPAASEMDWERGMAARRYQEAVAQLHAEEDGTLRDWEH